MNAVRNQNNDSGLPRAARTASRRRDATLADAICDSLVHCADNIELKGPSLRDTKAKNAGRKTECPFDSRHPARSIRPTAPVDPAGPMDDANSAPPPGSTGPATIAVAQIKPRCDAATEIRGG
jgi:hypothetical protein